MLTAAVVVVAAFIVPYSIEIALGEIVSTGETIKVLILLLFSLIIILWPLFDIRYEFFEQYLFIKGGPVRSKILYEDITIVKSIYFTVGDTLAGYRVLGSRDGIEINYKTGIMGHVRISPERREEFLAELKKRAPNAYYS